VSWLDRQHLCANTSTTNIPPIAANFPPGDTVAVPCSGVDFEIQFVSPEAGQTTTVAINDGDGAQAQGLVITNTPGNTARVRFQWTPGATVAGIYDIDMIATDSFIPPGQTTRSIRFIVDSCNIAPSCSVGAPATGECRTVVISGAAAVDPDDANVQYSWSGPAGLTFSPASGTASTAPGSFIPPTTVTLDASASACGVAYAVQLRVDDGRGGVSTCDGTVTFSDTTPPVVSGGPGGPAQHCLWPPNHRMHCFATGDLGVSVSDGCGNSTWAILGVASSQCDEAPCAEHPGENGDGNTTGDVEMSPDGQSFCVRSERAGTDPAGRFYDVVVEAVDDCGNRSAGVSVVRIHVPHDQSPGTRCR
jgi:hypothetical protein